jgi:hypothetical protein
MLVVCRQIFRLRQLHFAYSYLYPGESRLSQVFTFVEGGNFPARRTDKLGCLWIKLNLA